MSKDIQINIKSYMMFKHRHEHEELDGIKTIFYKVKDPFPISMEWKQKQVIFCFPKKNFLNRM